MSEDLTIELSNAEFDALCDLAGHNGLSPEEQAALIIRAHFNAEKLRDEPDVSIEFLRENVDAVLDATVRGPVFIRSANGRTFVIMLKQDYAEIAGPDKQTG